MNSLLSKRTLLLCGLVFQASMAAQAASFVVWPGQSLQAAVSNAAAGDNITAMSGVYDENVTIDKSLDIRCEPGRQANVTGSLTIKDVSGPVYLKDLNWCKQTSLGVEIANCTDVRIDNFKVFYQGLSAVNSKLYAFKGTIDGAVFINTSAWTFQGVQSGPLVSTNSDTKLLKCRIAGNASHLGPGGECTVFQTTVDEMLSIQASRYWVNYSTIRFLKLVAGRGEITGNIIDGRGDLSFIPMTQNGIDIQAGDHTIRNNLIQNFLWRSNYNSYISPDIIDGCNGINVKTGSALIVNNVIRKIGVYTNTYVRTAPTRSGNGITIGQSAASVEIHGIIIAEVNTNRSPYNYIRSGYSVDVARAESVILTTSALLGDVNGITLQPTNGCINADPQFADNSFTLKATSPCRDAGPPDPEYNDLDGTRNDMGWYGGHAYDPNGRTTTAPVVLSSEAFPLYIKRGGTITIKARGAVAAP